MTTSIELKELLPIVNMLKAVNNKQNGNLFIKSQSANAGISLLYCKNDMLMKINCGSANDSDLITARTSAKEFIDLLSLNPTATRICMSEQADGDDKLILKTTLDSDGKTAASFRIKHNISAFNEDNATRSELTRFDEHIISVLTNEKDTATGIVIQDRAKLISNLQKCLSTNTGTQIIMSDNAKAFASACQTYAIYQPDDTLALTATLTTSTAKTFIDVLKYMKSDHVYLYIDDATLHAMDEENQVYIAVSTTMARKAALAQITGMHSKVYDMNKFMINKKALLNAMHAYMTLSANADSAIELRLGRQEAAPSVVVTGQARPDCQIDIPASYDDIEACKDATLTISNEALKEMLSHIDSENVYFSTSDSVTTTTDDNETETDKLLRIAETRDNGTLGTRVYSII